MFTPADRMREKVAVMTLETGKRGVTLIELTLTMTLVGALAALAWPDMRRMAREWSQRSEAIQWEDRFRQTRARAILSARPVAISFEDLSTTYAASAPSVRFFPDGSAEPVRLRAHSHSAAVQEIRVDESGRVTKVQRHEAG